jgi:hypothetical protein
VHKDYRIEAQKYFSEMREGRKYSLSLNKVTRLLPEDAVVFRSKTGIMAELCEKHNHS